MSVASWHRGLAARLVLFLSVALIPVGLVAVLQTRDIVENARDRDDAALVSLTRDAAYREREIIQNASGRAVGLTTVARAYWGQTDLCSDALARFIAEQDTLITAGFIYPDGTMWCSSRGETFDFSTFPGWDDAVADPTPSVEVNAEAPVSRRPVVVVSEPFKRGGEFAGYVFVSIPHEALAAARSLPLENDLTVVTFTTAGNVLTTTDAEADDPESILPARWSLSNLAQLEDLAFQSVARNGETRSYAVSPVVDSTVYVLGTWMPISAASSAPIAIPPQFFPIIMWITSLGVVFATVYRLVIRHISQLRRQMRAFARTRQLPAPQQSQELSAEIFELQDAFTAMAETVLHDEAEMEQLLHDKNVLLKEVHHRVKNNLQLISSIMNMQIRQLKSQEAKLVVQRLQDRVLGLATIHRNLYRTENLSQVRTAPMLQELTDQIMAVGMTGKGASMVSREFDDIALYPDQAVPLSMLVAEAVTNALKYLGGDDGAWLRMSLSAADDGMVTVEVANSRSEAGTTLVDSEGAEGTGLGSSLMRAFAMQLGGKLETDETLQHYAVRVVFKRQGFIPEDVEDAAA